MFKQYLCALLYYALVVYLSVVWCIVCFCYVSFVTEENKFIMKSGEDISQLQNVKPHLNIKKNMIFTLLQNSAGSAATISGSIGK